MRCFYHPDRAAVAQCVECSKGLCSECAGKWNPPTCDGCGVSVVDDARKRMLMIRGFGVAGIICGIIAAIMIIILGVKSGDFNPAMIIMPILLTPILGYEYAAIPAGWWKLNNITSRMFLFLPIVGWLIYFGIKLSLSMFVGLFALPFEYKRLKNIINNN